MTEAGKLEYIRMKMALKARQETWKEDLAEEIILVAYWMGWKIDYIMKMNPKRFYLIAKILAKIKEKENQYNTANNIPQTLG